MSKKKPLGWTPFERARIWHNPTTGENAPIPEHMAIYRNNRYQVLCVAVDAGWPFGHVTWLSIKRNNRQPIHDWRELQRIKNELVGPEVEAVEIYPAESRLVDTSNQLHLWCFPNGYRLPFGYKARSVTENPGSGAVQRPWPNESRPADLAKDLADLDENDTKGLPEIITGIAWKRFGDDQ